MKKLLFLSIIALCAASNITGRRNNCRSSGYSNASRGYVGFGLNIGLPLGGVYYANGPTGSFPYYGTPVNYDGFYAPYGYAAYAGPVVTWGW